MNQVINNILNILIILITVFLGYILPFNPFKLKYQIANRFYPGKLGILKIFFSVMIIIIYFALLHYICPIFFNILGFNNIKTYRISFIMPFYLVPFLCIIWINRFKYGNVKIIYDKTKPNANELRNEIISHSKSIEFLGIKEKAVIISLCKYYLKRYGQDNNILKILKLLKN